MIDQRYFAQTDDYLAGRLRGAEKALFESELAQNADLAREFELQKAEREAMRNAAAEQMRARVGAILAQYPLEKPAEPRTVGLAWLRPLALAASVALAVGVVGWNWATQNFSSENLALEAFSASAGGLKSGDGDIDLRLFEAQKAFSEKDFAQAERLASSVEAENRDFFKAQKMLAEALFEQKKWTVAAPVLQKIAAEAPSDFEKDLAEIRLVAVWLADGKGETEPFRQLLNKIADDPRHEFQPRAAALREKMSSFWRRLAD